MAKEAYRAPFPDDRADVVISNACLADLWLAFARMKASHSLDAAPLHASRSAIASCSEGLGFHVLSPFVNASKDHWQRMVVLFGRMFSASRTC